MATHSSILAWRTAWTEEPGVCSPWGHRESDTTEWPTQHNSKYIQWNSIQPLKGRVLWHMLQREPNYSTLLMLFIAKSCVTLHEPTDFSMPGFPVLHYLLELAQTHIFWVNDTIQPSHPLLPPLPFAFNLSQHRGLFQWVISLHQVAKVLEL